MEPALESVCKDVRIGKILIQTNEDTDEPEVKFNMFTSQRCDRVGPLQNTKHNDTPVTIQ